MDPNANPVNISFTDVTAGAIKWQSKTSGGDMTHTGTFEVQGRKYEITVKHKEDQGGQVGSKITKALDEIGREHLINLSGHTLKTSMEDLQQKKITLIGSTTKLSESPSEGDPLHQAASTICDLFRNTFQINVNSNMLMTLKFKGRPDMKFLDRLKKASGERYAGAYNVVREQLGRIDVLLDKYEHGKDKRNDFYKGLNARIGLPDNFKINGHHCESEILLDQFLDEVEDILKEGTYTSDHMITSYLTNLVEADEEGTVACYTANKYYAGKVFEDEQRNKLKGIDVINNEYGLTKLSTGSKPTKVLIPVNIDGNHWMLYCFDNTDPKNPILYRADSFTKTTKQHLENNYSENIAMDRNGVASFVDNGKNLVLLNLEGEIKKDLIKDLGLDKKVQIKVVDAKVDQQCNNNCGQHVCKNAEWFVAKEEEPSGFFDKVNPFKSKEPKWNPDKILAKGFHQFRLDMVMNFLSESEHDEE